MRKIGLLILIGVSVTAAGWSAPMILDRDTSIELALENNRDFKISGISLETAAREKRTAWNEFLPDISASAGLYGETPLLDSQPKETAWTFNGSLDISLSLNAGLAYSIDGIRLAYESESITYESARQNLIAAVEKEFYYLIASEASMAIDKADLDLANRRYEQTRRNFENGLESELTMLQAQVSAKNLEPTYLQTVASFNSRVREFLIVLGLDPETEVDLEGSLDTFVMSFDDADLIERYISERPDIRGLKKNLEILANTRNITASGSRTPTLTLSSDWGTTVLQTFNQSSWENWTDGLSVGLTLKIPLDDLIPGSSTSVAIKELDDQVSAAGISLAQAVDEARTEIINLVDQLDTSAVSMELSELNVELAKTSYEMSEVSYASGTMERLDVEDAQQSYLEARHQYLLSQYEYLSGLIDLRSALGLDSLEELM